LVDVVQYNREAWDREASDGESDWCQPVSADLVAAARKGEFSIILTPNKPVPADWLGVVAGRDILGLASGGGQQVPILAAAGANVTSFDNSDAQLALDNLVAKREGLSLRTVQGDMADLSVFADESFDLIFNPVSTCFVPDVLPVWNECHRVLKPGGRLLSGVMNPAYYLFDRVALEKGAEPLAQYPLPYADPVHLSAQALDTWMEKKWAFEYSHTLEALIGGQTAAGLCIAGFYEDSWNDEATPLNKLMSTSIATLAIKSSIL
jgi:SAM-dependent methyltransferase